MSNKNKEVKETNSSVPVTLEDALVIIDGLKADAEKSAATIAELVDNNEKSTAKIVELEENVTELEEKLSKAKNSNFAAENAELQKTVEEMSEKIQLLEGNQSTKNILVKDTKGNNYKIKGGSISIENKKYSSEELSKNPQLIDYLVKKKSGFISPVE